MSLLSRSRVARCLVEFPYKQSEDVLTDLIKHVPLSFQALVQRLANYV